jgi:hypothetical protein
MFGKSEADEICSSAQNRSAVGQATASQGSGYFILQLDHPGAELLPAMQRKKEKLDAKKLIDFVFTER